MNSRCRYRIRAGTVPAVSQTDESHVTTSILGNRVVRTEDPRLLTVGGTYVHDVALEGAAWVTFVRASMAHAGSRSM
jgi:hypothetical protein